MFGRVRRGCASTPHARHASLGRGQPALSEAEGSRPDGCFAALFRFRTQMFRIWTQPCWMCPKIMRCRKETMRCRKEKMRCRKEMMRCRKETMRCRKEMMRCRKEMMRCRKEMMRCRKETMRCRKGTMRCRKKRLRCRKERLRCARGGSSHRLQPVVFEFRPK